jgi:hypothetical protein
MKNPFKKKKTLDYRYAENPDDQEWGAIRITGGDFKELIYHYVVVSFDERDDQCAVNFTYKIVDNPHHYPESEELRGLMGEILIELLQQRYGTSIDQGSDLDDNREDYIIKSSAE